jgi:holliday junction DNA helicase RuvB
MDLHALRGDQPQAAAARGHEDEGRLRFLSREARNRKRRAAGTVAGAAAGKMTRAEVTTPEALPDERVTDAALRPSNLEEFVGQAKVKESLQIAIDAAKQRKEPLDHTLFFGPPGLGKTTLALLMAREMGVQIRTTSGPVLERPGDLVGMLTGLKSGDILFIDEVHRLRPALEEFLYPAMEEFRVDVRIADGPHAQTIPMQLERFTLIGATTRFGLLTPPMRARFGLVERLHYYPPDDLVQIVSRSAGILGVATDPAGIAEIARRSRGTPRVANRLLKRVRDYAQVRAGGKITAAVAADALKRLDVDEFGLDDMDARILKTIIEQFDGGPVGLTTIAAAVGEDPGTLEEVYEPFLMQQGFLARTPRGRCATANAYRHFGFPPPAKTSDQANIFD